MRRILRRRPRDGAQGPRDLLRRSARSRLAAEHRDFTRPGGAIRSTASAPSTRSWTRLAALADLGAEADREGDYLAQSLRNLDRYLAELRRREEVTGGRDHDGLGGRARRRRALEGMALEGLRQGVRRDPTRAEVLARAPTAVKVELDAVLTAASADLRPALARAPAADRGVRRAQGPRRQARLPRPAALRPGPPPASSRGVREELNLRFSHLFVDEFQDTDPLQAEILLLLAADDLSEADLDAARPVPGKLFVVGDPKQSIYRFRRAEVALYEATKARLVECGASVLYLSTSFRSAPSIQEAVNAAFAPLMQERTAEGDARRPRRGYVALERFRDDPPEQPTVIGAPGAAALRRLRQDLRFPCAAVDPGRGRRLRPPPHPRARAPALRWTVTARGAGR